MPTDKPGRQVLVAGGAGYIGSVLSRELLAQGYAVRVLDSLLYGNGDSIAALVEADGFSFVHGDIRDAGTIETALEGITDVVLLAALVGDPVCKRNPELATETNVGGARNLIEAARRAAAERLVFASTCSNYGLRPDDQPATEADELHPLSLYAETKVQMEREILEGAGDGALLPTVLRVSTAYGISPRMRFDLTVSEFTRQLALGNELEVYDADTWRPYCHVNDISAAIISVLEAPAEQVAGEVFNIGGDDSNHTKRMIVEAALRAIEGDGRVTWTEGGADARNYRVSFAKINERLGFAPAHTVADSVARLVDAVGVGMFADVEARGLYYGNAGLTQGGEGSGGGDAG
jgi:nucleoside-diphosphate-sugar epimerase